MEIITRQQAIKEGLNKYFTGKPCKSGHISIRYVDNYSCKECRKERGRKWKIDNRERHNRYYREYNKKIGYKHCLHMKDPEENRLKSQKWRNENSEKAKKTGREGQARYYKTNPGKLRHLCYQTAKRLKKGDVNNKLNSLSYSPEEFCYHLIAPFPHLSTLEQAYGNGYSIDHIVPLSYICNNIEDIELAFLIAMDLDNLQLLPIKENMSKNNKINTQQTQQTIKYLWDKYIKI